MTVLGKPSKLKELPLVEDPCFEDEIIGLSKGAIIRRRPSLPGILCMAGCMSLLIISGVIACLQLYTTFNTDMSQRNHYQGYCSIPLVKDMQQLDSRKMQLRWKTSNSGVPGEPEIQVVSLLEEEPGADRLMDLLREVLDINVDESVEKISVFNNGRPVSFVHDFESNFTGIVDAERCFTMELDPSLVVSPEVLVLSLSRGEQFDVSRVRSSLRGVLPALRPARLPHALHHCANKPLYKLHNDDAVAIRKRSADAPPHDYMHFSGNRIQEIEISNLAEILEYEQNNKPVA